MARSNIIEFARSFQASFQRQQALELQQQREERFGRQLTANAGFRQADLNLRREQLDLQERQFERGPQGSFGAVQLGGRTGIVNRQTGEVTVPTDPATGTAFPSARVAGDTGSALPGKFALAAKLKESGLTGTAIGQLTQNIPADLNAEGAEGFLLGSEAAPTFEQSLLGFGKSFARKKGPNVKKEDVAPKFREFLQKTNFATATPDQRVGILRAFDESLGLGFEDGTNVVAKGQVEFDLESPFFQDIIKEQFPNPKTQKEFDSIPSGVTFVDDDGKIKVKR